MKRNLSNLFLVAACAGLFFVACSGGAVEDHDLIAGGAVEDHDIVAGLDTVFVHDSVFVNDTVKVKDTVKVVERDTVTKVERDTVTKVERDTVTKVKRDTITEVKYDTVEVQVKDTNDIYKGPISGVSQKGPFVKGSSVTIFELDGTNKLLQTGRSFNGTISADDGSFTVRNVSLASSYVYVTVTGSFRKETEAGKTMGKITLRALSDLESSRTTVNVNLITHLEYDRVVYLMENNPEMTLSEAKKQAEKEIFAAFFVDADKFELAENMDVLGTSEADAALLAISVMLPTNSSESGIESRITEMSMDLAEDGKIDDEKMMKSLALWTMKVDFSGDLARIRNNILSWGFSDNVPDFEKYMRKFWSVQLGIGECGSDAVPAGTIVPANAAILGASAYSGIIYENSDTRYTCVDSSGVGFAWRVTGAFEEDTLGLGRDFKDGDVHAGLVHKDSLFVFDDGGFRKAKAREILLEKGCTFGNKWDTLSYGYTLFECENGTWNVVGGIEGSVEDPFDATRSYKTIGIGTQMWMAENVNADLSLLLSSSTTADSLRSVCGGKGEDSDNRNGDCEKYGRFYTWYAAQFACPVGYRLPTKEDWEILVDFVGGEDSAGVALRSAVEGVEIGWYKPAGGAPDPVLAIDEYGFNAVPAGERSVGDGSTGNIGQSAVFWSSTEGEYGEAYYMRLSYSSAKAELYTAKMKNLKSVRCVKE